MKRIIDFGVRIDLFQGLKVGEYAQLDIDVDALLTL